MLASLTVCAFTALAPAQQGDQQPGAPAPTASATNVVKVGDYATIDLPQGWSYLQANEGQDLLVRLGNPRNPGVLGVAVNKASEIIVVFFYRDEGHVKDEDASTIDFGDLLAQMKSATAENNKERERQNLRTFELLGWAEPPHYDSGEKKLYYAERLRFVGSSDDTLNYFVRVLGRSGVLEMNAVGDMQQLEVVAKASKELLAATQFVAGKTYKDFNPSFDKIAAYGIGGLIAGKLLLKAGLLKLLVKPLIVAGAVLVGLFGRLLGKKKKVATEAGSAPPA